MEFEAWFEKVTGQEPYPYQVRFATDPNLPQLVDVPTGMGKTAMAVLGWLWRRLDKQFMKKTPRRLVYCLPMRVLVEQTYENSVRWLDRLGILTGKAEWEEPAQKKGLKHYRPQPDGSSDLIAVHLLMGGAEKTDWITSPERDAILIGTQDMLLSRALNRGYAAGRARWPMDFGLLNNDCLWVFDEVQLMSTSLATSLQLDAWRRILQLRGSDGFLKDNENPTGRACHSLWMSATMARHWLDSAVDWHPYASKAWDTRLCLTNMDHQNPRVKTLFEENQKSINKDKNPIARLAKPRTQEGKPDKSDAASKTRQYIGALSDGVATIAGEKAGGGLILIILNTVDRTIMLYEELLKKLDGIKLHLIHSRFRPMERGKWNHLFASDPQQLKVIVSTQVVEAGVDISAGVLFTELAPWPSLVQRFGRCARFPKEQGSIYWMDIDLGTDKQPSEVFARPYNRKELVSAREKIGELTEKGDAGLEPLSEIKAQIDALESCSQAEKLFPYDPRFVPRDKDLFDLFDTTPDLTGADIDISRYIRDDQEMDVQVFWRNVEGAPSKKEKPNRQELCPVSFIRFREQFSELQKKGHIWRRDYLKGWERLTGESRELIYPGQIFLLEKSCGGYDINLGWTGNPADQNFDLFIPELPSVPDELAAKQEENDTEEEGNPLSELGGWVKLSEHSSHVCEQMDEIGKELIPSELELSKLAARWHDRGKAHESFVANLKPDFLKQAESILGGEPAAKAPDGKSAGRKERDQDKDAWLRDKPKPANKDDRRRPGFRHELASALAIMETLRQVCPDHEVFKWPEGLDKSHFGCEPETKPNNQGMSPLVDELNAITCREDFDLLLYLVAAHHGKVRMSLRSSPDDSKTNVPDPCPVDLRQARGVRDGDKLPACKLPGKTGEVFAAPEVILNLEPMELGLSCRYGPSWRDRMQNLLEHLGPFRLAYLEALLRIADWRASRYEEARARGIQI